MACTTALPREVIKWLQSLDLSFSIKNPKRDLTNGYVIAEIMSRHYPKDVQLTGYENGTRLAAKVDNWEQLYKMFKKKSLAVSKDDIDRVIHCAPGAALAFLLKLYSLLTKKPLKMMPPVDTRKPLPPFMRDTASRRLKDPEIDRIMDKVEKTIRALDTLGYYHDERRHVKAMEAPALLKHERRLKAGAMDTTKGGMGLDAQQDSVQIDEVAVKAMTVGESQLRKGSVAAGQQTAATTAADSNKDLSGMARLLQAVSHPRTSAGALASLPQPAPFVKPASDIMRPLVYSIIQESEDLVRAMDTKKDILVAFMDQCRQGAADEVAVRVFETIASRCQMLVDTLTKSPPEFWKVWSTFSPAIMEFSDGSPVFESAVDLFAKLGEGMRELDPPVTQQLITEVALPSICREFVRAPEKREALNRIIYSFTQADTMNHLLVLRSIKEKTNDMPVYVSCLACLVLLDAQMGLLDEHLLDLYVYYALIAMQHAQPKIRVAGIYILSTITKYARQIDSITPLIPVFAQLATDEWWEVQSQVLLLACRLLGKVTEDGFGGTGMGGMGFEGAPSNDGVSTAGGEAVDSPLGEGGMDENFGMNGPVESLLSIINGLFVVSNSKNVLQVGLGALVDLLPHHTNLLPMYVSVLLGQPTDLRRVLLQPQAEPVQSRCRMVWGTTSLMYEDVVVSTRWPHLDVAKTFAKQLEGNPLECWEPEHMEVFQATLPLDFEYDEADEWIEIFSKLKTYIFTALIDAGLHINATQTIKRFWCGSESMSTKSIEVSRRAFLQALVQLYGADLPAGRQKVDEAAILAFLRELRARESVSVEINSLLEGFRESYPTEYQNSQLDTVFV